MTEKRCGTCKHWCPYDQIYDDVLEPNDFGECFLVTNEGTQHPISEEGICDKWEGE